MHVVNISFGDDSEKLVLGDPERFAVDSPTPGINVVKLEDAMVHGAAIAATSSKLEDGVAPGALPSFFRVRHVRLAISPSCSKVGEPNMECFRTQSENTTSC